MPSSRLSGCSNVLKIKSYKSRFRQARMVDLKSAILAFSYDYLDCAIATFTELRFEELPRYMLQ